MQEYIECINLYGNKVLIPKDQVEPSTRVYAVIVHDGKLLVITIRTTGKHYLPGGGVDDGETLEQALHRELMEEVGMEIEIKQPLFEKEIDFYHDTYKKAWHATVKFFECKPLTFIIKPQEEIDDIEASPAEWIAIKNVNPDSFQVGIQDIIQKIIEKYDS